MKLLHTSDWHLGARLGRIDRINDHLAALKGLIGHAMREQPDIILHTGDVFDGSRPSYDAMRVAVRAFARLSAIAPTVVLAGNHDSKSLFDVLHELAAISGDRRVWFVAKPDVLKIEAAGTQVTLACVPFVHPNAIVDLLTVEAERWEGSYADGIRSLNAQLLERAAQVSRDGVIVYAAHLHVHGARPGKSERLLTVGDDYATHASGLDAAVYAAFGHIHDPQKIPGGAVAGRYAGSLIPIDFGEREQSKHAVLVELGRDEREISQLALPAGRALVKFEGTLEELLARANSGGLDNVILKGVVTSEDPIPDLVDQLVSAAPRCHVFDLTNRVTSAPIRAIDTASEPGAEPSIGELFREWQSLRGLAAAPSEAVASLFDHVQGSDDVGELRVAALARIAEAAIDELEDFG